MGARAFFFSPAFATSLLASVPCVVHSVRDRDNYSDEMHEAAPASGGLQVLSDVDDTIKCSDPPCDSTWSCLKAQFWHPHAHAVQRHLAGVDKSLEFGEIYPGVGELYLGLALGPNKPSSADLAGPILFSARPEQLGTLAEVKASDPMNKYMGHVGASENHPDWELNLKHSMYGNLFNGTDFARFGYTKAKNYNTLSDRWPNTQFTFFGDNGQGDVCGAAAMLKSKNEDRLKAVFIHVVEDPGKSLKACVGFKLDLPEGSAGGRVHYLKTYSDGAEWALKRGLISCGSAKSVYDAADRWYQCRCLGTGGCSDLDTGVTTKATRPETLEYCAQVAKDQASLKPHTC